MIEESNLLLVDISIALLPTLTLKNICNGVCMVMKWDRWKMI